MTPAEQENSASPEPIMTPGAVFELLIEHSGKPVTAELAGKLTMILMELHQTDVNNGATEAEINLSGLGEAADMLGVSKQRVHQLKKINSFPKPVAELKATPVWKTADIALFGLHRKATGRPPRAKPEL